MIRCYGKSLKNGGILHKHYGGNTVLFVWDKSLEIGNDEIDSQHKEIFKRVNKLLSAMADGSGKDTIGKLIEFLTEYVVNHFDAEERLMRKHHHRISTA